MIAHYIPNPTPKGARLGYQSSPSPDFQRQISLSRCSVTPQPLPQITLTLSPYPQSQTCTKSNGVNPKSGPPGLPEDESNLLQLDLELLVGSARAVLVGVQGEVGKTLLVGEGVAEGGSGLEEVVKLGLEEGVRLVIAQDVLSAAFQEIEEVLPLVFLLGRGFPQGLVGVEAVGNCAWSQLVRFLYDGEPFDLVELHLAAIIRKLAFHTIKGRV